jgi:hypothetical protein
MRQHFLAAVLGMLLLASPLAAQTHYPIVTTTGNEYNHGSVGAFFNYTRLHNVGDTNFYGLGGRISGNITSSIALEAEGAYDFEQNTNVPVNLTGNPYARGASNLSIGHFMFGPKVQWHASDPVWVFGTLKGGLIDFSSNQHYYRYPYGYSNGATYATLYPGGGVELFEGPVGVRLEVGDEIYFNYGANSNLRVTAGPVFRF